jgi:hypothetical protein
MGVRNLAQINWTENKYFNYIHIQSPKRAYKVHIFLPYDIELPQFRLFKSGHEYCVNHPRDILLSAPKVK